MAPSLVVTHQLLVERRTGKVHRRKTDAVTTVPEICLYICKPICLCLCNVYICLQYVFGSLISRRNTYHLLLDVWKQVVIVTHIILLT